MDTSCDNDGKTLDALALNAAINHQVIPPCCMERSTAVKYFEWQHMLAAIKQPGICHVCGQHEFEIHSPRRTHNYLAAK